MQSEDLKSGFHDTQGITRSGTVINSGSFSFEDSCLSPLDPRAPGWLPWKPAGLLNQRSEGKGGVE